MDTNKITEVATKIGKYIGGICISICVGEIGALGAKMAADDCEYLAKTAKRKYDKIENRKRHWWSKEEEYSARTNEFISDRKKKKNK